MNWQVFSLKEIVTNGIEVNDFNIVPLAFVRNSDGDWEGLYEAGKLTMQGHSLNTEEALRAALNFGNSVKANARFYSYEIDSESIDEIGGFPDNFSDLEPFIDRKKLI